MSDADRRSELRRLTLEETWAELEAEGWEMPRGKDGMPFVPPRPPRYEDEELGFSFFKEHLEDADLSNLTLPRTYFGRALIERTAFRNTDLSESVMCWNNFEDCDFSGADLSRADMRATTYIVCSFAGATLTNADLRYATFDGCDFSGALTQGAILSEGQRGEVPLSAEQQAAAVWKRRPGAYPGGG